MNLYTERISCWHEGETVFVVEAGEDGLADVLLHERIFNQKTWHEASNLIAKAIMLVQGERE